MSPKPLSDYPRPPKDNGRGVHWSTSAYPPSDADLQFWIDELKAMQIKWVKLLDDGGGSSTKLCQALLENDIMPIVRLYRERPNPGHIGGREEETLARLIEVGVRYFETNNEPDLPAEWQNNHRPENWLDIVVENFIYDADVIQNLGGLPAFPAMGPGAQFNGLAKVVERGRIDIFEKGAWLAIHNYTLNHPLDYPYDPVNQEGQPLTQEEYERLAAWQYSHLSWEEIQALGLPITREDYDKFNRWAWDGRTLEEVNAVRAAHKNPGATIFDDANCFRAWEWWGDQVYQTLGFHIPIISTEGGPVTGWGDDDRYAKVNPFTQAQWQMEIIRFLQDEAPPWYFTVCTWLLAAYAMGDFNPAWEQMAWYTHAWDLQFGLDGQLPIVQMLKDTPARVRHELRGDDRTAAVMGVVQDSQGQPLAGITLELQTSTGEIAARDLSDDQGRFQLEAEPGVYDLFIPWWGPAARHIELTEADVDVITIHDLDPPGHYTITGTVRDATGLNLPEREVLLRRHGVIHARTQTDALGAFTFHPGLAGTYTLITPGASQEITLSPENPVARQDLTPDEAADMRYQVVTKRLLPPEETGNREAFYGKVMDQEGRGMNGIELEMRWENAEPGIQFPRTLTGSDPFKPDGYYEFVHTKGTFMIQVVQGDYESEVADGLETAHVPGREGDRITYEVNFQLLPVGENQEQSLIVGHVPGGRVGQTVILWKDGMKLTETALDTSRTFRFSHLGPGVYDVELAGIGLIATELALDGQAQTTLNLPLMSAIVGQVIGQPPDTRGVKLISETYGFVRHAELTQDGHYRFTNLPAGRYRVEQGDDILSHLILEEQSVLEAPPLRVGMGAQPQQSRIYGQVRDAADHPVAAVALELHVHGDKIAATTSDPQGQYAFDHLGPGVYEITLQDGVNVSGIILDGTNQVEVDLLYTPLAQAPAKRLDRYYLLHTAHPRLTPALLRLVLPWLTQQPPGPVGFSLREAQFAQTVVLLGDGIPASALALLQKAQCEIIDMRGDLLALARRLEKTS